MKRNSFSLVGRLVSGSTPLWIHGNRAHALMFLGRLDETRAIDLERS